MLWEYLLYHLRPGKTSARTKVPRPKLTCLVNLQLTQGREIYYPGLKNLTVLHFFSPFLK